MRFHLLVNPLVPTTVDGRYNADAFNQFAIKLARMLTHKNHQVYFYGTHETAIEGVGEYIPVLTSDDYKDRESKLNDGLYLCNMIDSGQQAIKITYFTAVLPHLQQRVSSGDIFLHAYEMVDKIRIPFPKCYHVMPMNMGGRHVHHGFTIYSSYAWANYVLGSSVGFTGIMPPENEWTIIPPIFDPTEFTYSSRKRENTILYLARIQHGKGVITVINLAFKCPNTTFLLVGNWDGPTTGMITIDKILCNLNMVPNVKFLGYANAEKRRQLLSEATALIQPSPYCEPFGFNVIEANLSGTPVITSDQGAFSETVIQGKTGYRCRTEEEYLSAIINVSKLSSEDCLAQGMKYTEEELAPRFMNFFAGILKTKP